MLTNVSQLFPLPPEHFLIRIRGYWTRVVTSHGLMPNLPIDWQNVEGSRSMGEDRFGATSGGGKISSSSPCTRNIDKVDVRGS